MLEVNPQINHSSEFLFSFWHESIFVEWITPAACVWIVDSLINDYASGDAEVRSLLDYWNVYVAPSLNPDGKL